MVKISNQGRVLLATAAISVWAISILMEADRLYTMAAIFAFSSIIIFTGDTSKELFESKVPLKQQLWVWLFVALMVGNGFHSRMTGRPFIPDLTSVQLKWAAGAVWVLVLIGAVLALVRGRRAGEA